MLANRVALKDIEDKEDEKQALFLMSVPQYSTAVLKLIWMIYLHYLPQPIKKRTDSTVQV